MLDGSSAASVIDVADRPGAEDLSGCVCSWCAMPTSGEWSAISFDDSIVIAIEAMAFRRAIATVRGHPKLAGMAETGRAILEKDLEGEPTAALLLFARRGTLDAAEGSQDATGEPVLVSRHHEDVEREANRIARRLGVSDEIAEAIALAGSSHDLGKDWIGWQKAIGNWPHEAGQALAKSKQRGFDNEACGRYRHEFGSLREARNDPAITGHAERDLILHLIAAHHGWGRPHFDEHHWDRFEGLFGENETIAAEVLGRYGRLQRRFGRWGLAWLEALLRSADYHVSSGMVEEGPEP